MLYLVGTFGYKITDNHLILNDINKKINELDKRKDEIQKLISEVNQQKNKLVLDNEGLKPIPVTINYMGGRLRDKPQNSGNVIVEIPKGDTILVFNWYEKPYFKAAYNEKVGFISYVSLDKNEQVESIIDSELFNKNPKLARLKEKYGDYDAQRIIKGRYWIGMTKGMARESLGSPEKVNKSTGTWGVNEQWVYSKRELYLYFENGILSSIQD